MSGKIMSLVSLALLTALLSSASAQTFWSDGGKIPYHTKGATGYGVDLTLRFLQSLVEED